MKRLKPSDIPYELHAIKDSLTLQVQYFIQKLKSFRENAQASHNHSQSNQSITAAASRKRTNSISQYISDSDSMEQLPPPAKRERLGYDRNLMYSERCETPQKGDFLSQYQNSNPTSSKYLQMSASKLYSGKDLAEVTMDCDFDMPAFLAKRINESIASIDQAHEKAGDIVGTMPETLDTLVNKYVDQHNLDFVTYSPASGSHANSDEDCEIVSLETNGDLNTPIPIASTSTGTSRYELRSNRKSASAASVESKRKPRTEKAQILSDERVSLSLEVNAQTATEPIELLDSDSETVTTTTQQHQPLYIPLQQAGFTQVYDAATGVQYILQFQSQPQYQSASSTVDITDTTTANSTTSNVIDESQFTINDGSQVLSIMVPNPNATTIENDERNRLIVVNTEEVNSEGSQSVQMVQVDQQPSAKGTVTEQPKQIGDEVATKNLVVNDSTDLAADQLQQISGQKVVTPPKQSIKSHIPGSSRSLSTPRNKNPHVRVLDFNCTPNRFRLTGIEELKNESMSTASRFFTETPHNRSIVSTQPSSAPPKVDSTIQRRRISVEKAFELSASTADAFVPSDENTVNTVISGDGETPKVRKSNRRACSRSISTHKEIHADVIEKRSKRVAATKKKICHDDGDSNSSEENNKKPDTNLMIHISSEDAMAEWQRARNASKNPELFEQQLREQNSKKQGNEQSAGRKKRPTRSKKKTAAAAAAADRKKQTDKISPKDSTKAEDISLNSSLENDTLNSTQLNLEARLLEENLRSAKKITPIKLSLYKPAKKGSPMGKLQIKLMPSPKNKALKRLRSSKNLSPANGKNKCATVGASNSDSDKLTAAKVDVEKNDVANKVVDSGAHNQLSNESTEKTADIQRPEEEVQVAENLVNMEELIALKENQMKKDQANEMQSDSNSMLRPPADKQTGCYATTSSTDSMPIDKVNAILMNNANQTNLSMSALLETPFKDCGLMLPQTPNFANLLPQLTTP